MSAKLKKKVLCVFYEECINIRIARVDRITAWQCDIEAVQAALFPRMYIYKAVKVDLWA